MSSLWTRKRRMRTGRPSESGGNANNVPKNQEKSRSNHRTTIERLAGAEKRRKIGRRGAPERGKPERTSTWGWCWGTWGPTRSGSPAPPPSPWPSMGAELDGDARRGRRPCQCLLPFVVVMLLLSRSESGLAWPFKFVPASFTFLATG